MANIGIDLVNTQVTLEKGKGFGLGDRQASGDGRVFIYLQAAAAITDVGYVCFYSPATHTATMITTANDAALQMIAIAMYPVAISEYGWFQIAGACSVRVLASAVLNTRLNTTATAGALDDDGTATTFAVNGLTLTATNGGSQATVAGSANYPMTSVIAI